MLNAGDKVSCDLYYEFVESGLYIVKAHADFSINGYYPIWNMQYAIVIVLE